MSNLTPEQQAQQTNRKPGGQYDTKKYAEPNPGALTTPPVTPNTAVALLDDIDFDAYDLRDVPPLPEALKGSKVTTGLDDQGHPMAEIWDIHSYGDAHAWAVDDGTGNIVTENSVDVGNESGIDPEHERAVLNHLEAVAANVLIVRHAVLSELEKQPGFDDRVSQIARSQH